MASFFQRQVAKKIIPFLKCKEGSNRVSPNAISAFIKVNRQSKSDPELLMPWRNMIAYRPDIESSISLPKLVNQLRNQGLPTAEGVIDIGLSESPLGVTFTIDKHVFSKIVLKEICENEELFGTDSCFFHSLSPKKILVHFSLPSVGDIFSMSHFRSTIHSNFIENVNLFLGNPVDKVYSMTDWNLKSALMLTGYKQFGNEKELTNDPSSHLFEVFKMASQLYKNDVKFQNDVHSCFENNEEINKTSDWFYIRNLCLQQQAPLLERLDLSFDNVRFDSSSSSESKKVYEDLIAKNLITLQPDGTLKANFISESEEVAQSSFEISEHIIYNLCSTISSVTQLEATQNFDILYYVAPKSEEKFFVMLSSLLKELEYSWSEKLCFIGLKNITDFDAIQRKRLSAKDIFNEAKNFMLNKLETDLYLETSESLEKVADILSYSSLLMFNMKHRRNSNYSLDWREILHFERNSGAAFQLCHAGLKGMLEDNEILFKVDIDTSPLLEPEAQKLILHLARFDEMVFKSYMKLEPCFLYQYLSTLWHYTDRAANVLKLDLKSDRMIVIKARLLLFSATLNILQKCLKILGLKPFVNKYHQPKLM